MRHPVIVFVCLLTYLRVGSLSRACHTHRGERTVLSSHCGVQGVTLVLPMFLPAEPSRQPQWWVGWFLFFVRDIKSGMVAYTYNLSTWQTGAGDCRFQTILGHITGLHFVAVFKFEIDKPLAINGEARYGLGPTSSWARGSTSPLCLLAHFRLRKKEPRPWAILTVVYLVQRGILS